MHTEVMSYEPGSLDIPVYHDNVLMIMIHDHCRLQLQPPEGVIW